jgi:predicted metal-dependent phosphoesterase TrpH
VNSITYFLILCYPFFVIDLHTHSTASDGVLSPRDLVEYAAAQGVTLLALTDHDTVAGLPEAQEAASRLGVTFVPGIEFTITWKNGDFHLLGLGLQNPQALVPIIRHSQEERNRRNNEIIQRMRAGNIPVTLEEVQDLAQTSSVGRPHFADFLVSRQIVKTRQIAFDRYLSKGRPFYAEHPGESLTDVIMAIKNAGGLPVVAHPLSLYVSWSKMEGVFAGFKAKGIVGIEAWHSNPRVVDCKRLEALAEKLGLFVTAGSDFHEEQTSPGAKKPGSKRSAAPFACKIGHTAGGLPIDHRFLPKELEAHLAAR